MNNTHTHSEPSSKARENAQKLHHFDSEGEDRDEIDDLLDMTFNAPQPEEKEDFEFKPLTKGLGFHQEKREPRVAPQRGQDRFSSEKAREVNSPSYAPQRSQQELSYAKKNELYAFYGEAAVEDETTSQQREEEEIASPQPERVRAKKSELLAAFLIDLFVVSGLFTLISAGLGLLSGLSLGQLRTLFSLQELAIFSSLLFSLLYLFYFTILDLGGTVGKSLMSLSLRKTDDSRLTIFSTLVRSLVSLLSLPLVGVPMFFDFQGKLSDTEVVEDK